MRLRSLCLAWVVTLMFAAMYGCGGGNQPGGGGNSNSGGDGTTSASDGEGDGTGDDGSSADGESDGTEVVSTEGWGHLKGKFIVTGAPAPEKITVSGNDVAVCGKFDLVSESIVAGPEGELANVILTLYTPRGDEPVAPHESYAKTADASVVMDNKDCRFDPHVTLLRTSQTLVIKNSDPVGHNTKIESQNNPINPIIPPGQSLEETGFDKPERLPVGASCSIHSWMKGYLVVLDSPYMAATDEQGEFLMENLPAGKHTFTVWHEASGYVSDVQVNGSAKSWSRGRVDVIIRDGETTDLGEVKVSYDKLSG